MRHRLASCLGDGTDTHTDPTPIPTTTNNKQELSSTICQLIFTGGIFEIAHLTFWPNGSECRKRRRWTALLLSCERSASVCVTVWLTGDMAVAFIAGTNTHLALHDLHDGRALLVTPNTYIFLLLPNNIFASVVDFGGFNFMCWCKSKNISV